MEKMEEMKNKWSQMMTLISDMDNMMKGMDTAGMEEMADEWEDLKESADKMQTMMTEKENM